MAATANGVDTSIVLLIGGKCEEMVFHKLTSAAFSFFRMRIVRAAARANLGFAARVANERRRSKSRCSGASRSSRTNEESMMPGVR